MDIIKQRYSGSLLLLCVLAVGMLPGHVMSRIYPAASYSEIMAEEGEVKATAVIRHLLPGDCRYAEKMMWGAGGKCPETAIAALFITCSTEKIYVWRSAYADLGNVESVEVSRDAEDGHYVVTIKGGKADAAYIASLDIIIYVEFYEAASDISKVRQRTVVKRDSPDKIEERTRYSTGEIVRLRESCNS